MSTLLLFPYRTPSADSISEPKWVVNESDIVDVDLSAIDYHSSLSVQCDLDVNAIELRKSTGVRAEDFEWLLTARSDGGGLYHILAREPVRGGAHSIGGVARIAELGEVATLQLQLTRCNEAERSDGILVARHESAILWNRATRLSLSGIGSRFAVQTSSFADDPSYRNALWRVDVDRSDPTMSVSAAARILLNERHPDVVTLLQADGAIDLAQRLIRSQLKLDVARQFICFAREVHQEESTEAISSLPFDSVGAVALRFADKVRRQGNLDSLSELWMLMSTDPSKIELFLQALYLAPAAELS